MRLLGLFVADGLDSACVSVSLAVVFSLALTALAIPLAGTISFEENLDADGTQFDTWDVVTSQYAEGYGITFSKLGTNATDPTIFNGVLPDYYPPQSGTRILSNWSHYRQVEPTGNLRVNFDVSPNGFGGELSKVNGWVTVASNSGNPGTLLTIEGFSSSGALIDRATVLRNLGSSDFFELRGDRDIAYVVFKHSEGPTDYHWSLDDLGYSAISEPAMVLLVGLGCVCVALDLRRSNSARVRREAKLLG